jgi:hypothetical protein
MAMRKRPGLIAGTLLSLALLLAGTGQAFAAQPTEQQVRKLMDAIGLGRSMSQMNTQIATSMKEALPCVASNYWQDFIDQAGSTEFIGRLVPIYQKHFTAEEVDGLVKFYSSPLGQKVLTRNAGRFGRGRPGRAAVEPRTRSANDRQARAGRYAGARRAMPGHGRRGDGIQQLFDRDASHGGYK